MDKPYVWITGAHGFIGRHLAQHLKANYWVAGIGHGTWQDRDAESCGVSFWINGEISTSNLGQMQESLGSPEVIFHLAGGSSVGNSITHPYDDFTRTVVSTATILDWVRQQSYESKIVAVSSAAVYGAEHDGPISEDAPLSPYSPYGSHKLMMEELCRSYAINYGLKIVLPRLFSVYGPGLKKQLLWDLCQKISRGRPIQLGGNGNELRDWINIRDVVNDLTILIHTANTNAPVFNLATGKATSVTDIAQMLITHWKKNDNPVPTLAFNRQSRPGDPFSLIANISKKNKLGLENKTPISQGISEYVSWYKSL